MEEFRDIKGYEGKYQVSNLGRVKSLRKGKELILRQATVRGYRVVGLYKDFQSKNLKVHRLVAEAFIPNPLGLPCVNHKDENKTNNRADNLEWCTHKYNDNYGTRNERMGRKLLNRENQSKKVYQYTTTGDFIKMYPSRNEAARLNNLDKRHIGHCCLGQARTHGGYIWSYDPPKSTIPRVLF